MQQLLLCHAQPTINWKYSLEHYLILIMIISWFIKDKFTVLQELKTVFAQLLTKQIVSLEYPFHSREENTYGSSLGGRHFLFCVDKQRVLRLHYRGPAGMRWEGGHCLAKDEHRRRKSASAMHERRKSLSVVFRLQQQPAAAVLKRSQCVFSIYFAKTHPSLPLIGRLHWLCWWGLDMRSEIGQG